MLTCCNIANVSAAKVEKFKFDIDAASLGIVSDSLDKLKDIGKKFFKEISKSAFALCCGSASGGEELKKLLGEGVEAIIASVAALLIAQLAIAAAIATIVATLIVKLFVDAGGKVLCSEWKDSLPA